MASARWRRGAPAPTAVSAPPGRMARRWRRRSPTRSGSSGSAPREGAHSSSAAPMTPASSPRKARSTVTPTAALRETFASKADSTSPRSSGQPRMTPPPRMTRAGLRSVTTLAMALTRERSPCTSSSTRENAPAVSSSRTRAAMFMPLVYASRQPSSPQPHWRGAPPRSGRTFTCPSSPARPRCPSCSRPPRMRPDPTPEPTKTSTASSNPRAAPKRRSPQAAVERSFAMRTGTARRAASSAPNGTSRQPRLGAHSTTPVRPRHWPATPTPTRPKLPGSRPCPPSASRTRRATVSTTAAGLRSWCIALCEETISPESRSTIAARALVPPRSTPSASDLMAAPGAGSRADHLSGELLDLLGDELPDLGQARRARRLEPQHEQGLGVRRAHEPPAVREGDAHPVDRHRLVPRGEEGLGPLHDLELRLLRAGEVELGGGEGLGHVGEERGERRGGAREELEQARRRVDPIVEAEPAVGEEDVPAHLPAEEAAHLLHLGLDEAVPRLPHDGPAAAAGDVVEERHGALHLGHDRGARILLQQRAREEDHEPIAPEDVPLLVDRADPVGVAVVGDAQVGLHLPHLPLQRLEVLLDGRVGVVVRKAPVHLDEERDHLEAQRREERHRHDPARPVAGVDHHLEATAAQPEVLLHVGAVAPDDLVLLDLALPALEAARRDEPPQLLDPLAVQRRLADGDLEAVVLGRVVRARDHAQPIHRQRLGGEGGERRRHHPDVDDVDAGLVQPRHRLAREALTGQPAVPPHHHPRPACAPDERPEPLPDRVDGLLGEIPIHEPADVILAEDGGGDARRHGPRTLAFVELNGCAAAGARPGRRAALRPPGWRYSISSRPRRRSSSTALRTS